MIGKSWFNPYRTIHLGEGCENAMLALEQVPEPTDALLELLSGHQSILGSFQV